MLGINLMLRDNTDEKRALDTIIAKIQEHLSTLSRQSSGDDEAEQMQRFALPTKQAHVQQQQTPSSTSPPNPNPIPTPTSTPTPTPTTGDVSSGWTFFGKP